MKIKILYNNMRTHIFPGGYIHTHTALKHYCTLSVARQFWFCVFLCVEIKNQKRERMERVELISADPFEFTDIVNSSRRKMLRPRRIFATALKSSNSRRRVRLIVVVVETQF